MFYNVSGDTIKFKSLNYKQWKKTRQKNVTTPSVVYYQY